MATAASKAWLWAVGCGLWVVGCGLWSAAAGVCRALAVWPGVVVFGGMIGDRLVARRALHQFISEHPASSSLRVLILSASVPQFLSFSAPQSAAVAVTYLSPVTHCPPSNPWHDSASAVQPYRMCCRRPTLLRLCCS